MASAQYETRTRTVEERFVVLTLTEDEAEELREMAGGTSGRLAAGIYRVLASPTAAEAATDEAGDTFTHSGITYEIGVLYHDTEGDYFEMRREIDAEDGTPVGRYRYCSPTAQPGDWAWTLAEVVHNHGPLTKVTP
ncbi:phiSA1p31-related protein [Streptomyces sp. NPDC002346]